MNEWGLIAPPLGDAVLDFDTPVTVYRFSAPARDGGIVSSEPEIDSFEAHGSFQPMSQKEAQYLPEGIRVSGASKFYTDCALRTASASDCNLADKVVDAAGVEWEVVAVEDWSPIGGYYKATLTRSSR